MKFRRWTAEEDAFMAAHYAVLGPEICGRHLKRTRAATQQHAWKQGYARRNPSLTKAIYMRVLLEECERVNLPPELVMSRSTKAIYTAPKFRTWRRLHDMGYSYPQIAKRADRDHTAVLHGARRAHDLPPPPIKLISPVGGVDRHMNTFRETEAA